MLLIFSAALLAAAEEVDVAATADDVKASTGASTKLTVKEHAAVHLSKHFQEEMWECFLNTDTGNITHEGECCPKSVKVNEKNKTVINHKKLLLCTKSLKFKCLTDECPELQPSFWQDKDPNSLTEEEATEASEVDFESLSPTCKKCALLFNVTKHVKGVMKKKTARAQKKKKAAKKKRKNKLAKMKKMKKKKQQKKKAINAKKKKSKGKAKGKATKKPAKKGKAKRKPRMEI